MNVCKYKKRENSKPCSHYIKPALCSRPNLFRCIEYIARFEPTLSYSGVNHFLRCPRQYYLSNIKGLQLQEQYQSYALKIGKYVDAVLTVSPIIEIPEVYKNELWVAKAQAMLAAFNNLFPELLTGYTGQKEFYWQEYDYPHVNGFIDLEATEHFVELKCTSRPEFYTNPFWIHDQIGTYFLSNPNYDYGVVWAIRVPQLKQSGNFRDESLGDYKDRCVSDMLRRPAHYFPGYNKDSKLFGVKFYRSEFDLNALRKRYKWIARQIRECAQSDYWYQNRTQCLYPFKCDYLNICETGGISEDIYRYRHSGNGGSLANRAGNAGEQPVTHKA
jgi:hypothetical protein